MDAVCMNPKMMPKEYEYCEREQQIYLNGSDTQINVSAIDCSETADCEYNDVQLQHSNSKASEFGYNGFESGNNERKSNTKRTKDSDESTNERNTIFSTSYFPPFTNSFAIILVTHAFLALFVAFMVALKYSRIRIRKTKKFDELDEIRLKTECLKVNDEKFSNSNSSYGTYNSETVLISRISKKWTALKPNTIYILKEAYKLRKDTVNSFLGFIHNESERNNLSIGLYLVWEFGFKSLYQIIDDPDFEIDFKSKTSILFQIAKGMHYIHESAINFHGSLSSHNCVVNSNFSVKIIEFGTIRIEDSQEIGLQRDQCLLWRAPELLRLKDQHFASYLTQSADVYSYAIIASEVISHRKPYASIHLSLHSLIERLKNPPPIIRPKISATPGLSAIAALAVVCWDEDPSKRLKFAQIIDAFIRMNCCESGTKLTCILPKPGIIGLLRDSKEENETKDLLHKMLPIPVANLLKAGVEVPPERFDAVTIMFSDIVGFTTISAFSKPMEVIDLLNELYTIMDTTILSYEVYKVETIGDAYMLVSGIPNRNVDHAEQIASAALDILDKCSMFKIKHLPKIPFNIRIGINSGDVVAGVVGKTMPRYSLFGDTVNVASRMESTGRAFAIHISKSTATYLRKAGNFGLTYRGDILLKGVGKQATYWLTGKRNSRQFPLPSDIEGEDNHGFLDDSLFRQNTV